MAQSVMQRVGDDEWYTISGTDGTVVVVRGRRNAWDQFRQTVGPLPEDLQAKARGHLEDTDPSPPGLVARGYGAHDHLYSMRRATSAVGV